MIFVFEEQPGLESQEDGIASGTITVEDQLRFARAGRRDAEIASGHNRAAGTGAHGGNKLEKRRKERRQSKGELRSENY